MLGGVMLALVSGTHLRPRLRRLRLAFPPRCLHTALSFVPRHLSAMSGTASRARHQNESHALLVSWLFRMARRTARHCVLLRVLTTFAAGNEAVLLRPVPVRMRWNSTTPPARHLANRAQVSVGQCACFHLRTPYHLARHRVLNPQVSCKKRPAP